MAVKKKETETKPFVAIKLDVQSYSVYRIYIIITNE